MRDGLNYLLIQCYKQIQMSQQIQVDCETIAQISEKEPQQISKHYKSKSSKIIKNSSQWQEDKLVNFTHTIINQRSQNSIYPSSTSSSLKAELSLKRQLTNNRPIEQDENFLKRYNQLNSLPINRISSAVSQISTLEPIAQQFLKLKQKINVNSAQLHKYQQIAKDKQKFPIKYKIAEECGMNQQKIFKMKDADLRRVQQDYMKQKGIEYLQQSRQIAKIRRKLTFKTEPSQQEEKNILQPHSKKKDPNYVRQIFKQAAVIAKAREQVKLQKQKSQKKLQTKLKQMTDRQELLGYIAYVKTYKHIKKTKRQELSYLEQLKSQQRVDQSIIQFLRGRIKRVKTQTK